MIVPRETLPAWAEVFPDSPEWLQESLRMLHRLEAAHHPLPLPRRLVRVLYPVVEALVLAASGTGSTSPIAAP